MEGLPHRKRRILGRSSVFDTRTDASKLHSQRPPALSQLPIHNIGDDDDLFWMDDTEDSPSKHKHNMTWLPWSWTNSRCCSWMTPRSRPGPRNNKYWRTLALITFLVWHGLIYGSILHSRALTTTTIEKSFSSSSVLSSLQHQQVTQNDDLVLSQRKRQERCRPHRVIDPTDEMPLFLTPHSLSPSTDDWKTLCQNAQLSVDAHVLVVHPLDALSPALLSLLHHQCQVQHVTLLLDDFSPLSSSSSRSQPLMDRLHNQWRPLLQHLPHVETVVLSSSLHNDASAFRANDTTISHIIQFPNPTERLCSLHHSVGDHHHHDNYDDDDAIEISSQCRLRAFSSATMVAQTILDQILLPYQQQQPKGKTPLYLVLQSTDDDDEHDSNNHNSLVFNQWAYRMTTAIHAQAHVAAQHLTLPPVFGPLVWPKAKQPGMYVANAVRAILQVLSRPADHHPLSFVLSDEWSQRKDVPTIDWLSRDKWPQNLQDTKNNQTHNRHQWQTLAWLSDQLELSISRSDKDSNKGILPSTNAQMLEGVKDNEHLFGIRRRNFPCASVCSQQNKFLASDCARSVWDEISFVSRNATSSCPLVAYQVNWNTSLQELPKLPPSSADSKELCRIVYISDMAPIVRTTIDLAIHNATVPSTLSRDVIRRDYNGRLDYFGWTLIWMPVDHSPSSAALPVMDPTRLFGDTVAKAMYIHSSSFAQGLDGLLTRILRRVDQPSKPKSYVQERRPGTAVTRWKTVAARKARKTLFFAGAAAPQVIADEDPFPLSQPQQRYYQTVSDWLWDESDDGQRHDFPFRWISMDVFVHDFTVVPSQQLRCAWYREFLDWNHHHHLQDDDEVTRTTNLHLAASASLAYVLGQQTLLRRLSADTGWVPFLDKRGHTVQYHNLELYLRILPRA